MMARRMTRNGRWFDRLVPASLGARLTASLMLSAAVSFVLVATIVGLSFSYYARSLAIVSASGTLTEARTQLDLRARELDALVLTLSDTDEFYEQTVDPDAAFVGERFDPWLRDHAGATAVLWADATGSTVSSFGSEADLESLALLAEGSPNGARGPIVLPSGPAVVAVRPIVGNENAGSAGFIAVASPISSDWFAADGGQATDVASTASLPVEQDGWREVDSPRGYEITLCRLKGGLFVTRGAFTCVDGRSMLVVEVQQPDPWLGEGRAWIIFLVPFALGLAVLGVAYLVGTSLGRSIVRPLERFIEYLQDQGYLALQGLRTDEELLIDPALPADYSKLGEVITDLMTQLRINQSDLIEAGDQALAAERAFRTVVEESPEVKILVRGGVVEIANPAAAHFFGLQLGDLLRAEPDGLFTGIQLFDESGEPLRLLNMARQAHETPVVARCVSADQPDRWIELSVAFIDPDGADYVISARNITEERRLEALRQEVLSLVSHDLRSPLTVVRGYLDILDKPLEDERRKKAVESARLAALRMEGLLDDLLHATRAETVFAPRVMRPVDLSVLVDGVATSLQMGAEQEIITSLAPGVTVLGDPVRLEQAITNLVGNAVKHGPAEGQVRVAVAAHDDRAVVSVEDDGPGIPVDQREAVFERGARGSAPKSTPGMGLGLYIVRVVAEAHGGLAFVDDSARGTRFVLDLPLVKPETSEG
jgi:signal transduction histidine kinase